MNEEQTTRTVDEPPTMDQRLKPSSDLLAYFRQYAHESPKVVALACLGIGFALGWKLRIW